MAFLALAAIRPFSKVSGTAVFIAWVGLFSFCLVYCAQCTEPMRCTRCWKGGARPVQLPLRCLQVSGGVIDEAVSCPADTVPCFVDRINSYPERPPLRRSQSAPS